MESKEHKKIAIQCFNAVWTILDKVEPSDEEKLEAIRLAQTSTWHWYQCGEPIHFQRGEWICSRVYCQFNHLEEALYHARLCRDLTQKYELKDFDLSYSYEALARVYRKLNNTEKFNHYFQLLVESLDQIADSEDKKQVERDIQSMQ